MKPDLVSAMASMKFKAVMRGLERKLKLPDHAGIVMYRKARSTGTHVGLYDALEAGFESDPETPWATVCEEHGGIVCHATRKAAETYLSHPEDWCPTCQEGP
jgi:hypothetical protein